MKLKLYNTDFYGIGLCLITLVLTLVMPIVFSSISGVVVLLIISALIIAIYGLYLEKTKIDVSFILIYPIILSAFQNVFIGMVSPQLDQLNTQMLLSVNYFVTIELLFLWVITSNKEKLCKWFLSVLLLMIGYSVILIPFRVPSLASFIACFRNISSPIIFFLFGYCFRNKININRFFSIAMFVFFVVAVFGIIELYLYQDFWINNNIKELWENKGFSVMDWGLPANVYSSEMIGGHQLRRMISTFADPVNLGTFLFCGLMIAWFTKRKFMTLLLLVCCVLTISKGALLGILIFFVVYCWFIPKNKTVFFMALIFGGIVGGTFLIYSRNSSTGSVFAHISGLTSAFASIFTNPVGYGVGNVGVLATYLGANANSAVIETGLGAVVSQLGIIGLLLYVVVFGKFIRISHFHKTKREAVFLVTLVLAILANILFNEVALSPNSSALYFMIIGLYSTKKTPKEVKQNAEYLHLVRG